MGDIAVVPAEGHGRHDPALLIAPANGINAGGLADRRGATLGPHGQRRLDHRAVGEHDPRHGRAGLDSSHRRRRADFDAGRRHRIGQGHADAPVLDHIAERLPVGAVADLVGVKTQKG